MNHIALLGDTHWDFSDLLLESQFNFIKKQFIPYLKENEIDTIIQFGDLFDNRKHMTTKVMNQVLELFDNDLSPFQFHIFCGNHDVQMRNTNSINSLKLISRFSNVHLYEDITKVKIKNRKFLMVPWLYDLNLLKNYLDKNDVSDVEILCGHLDLIGGQMSKSTFSKTGLTKELLKPFKKVFSGHYHSISFIQNETNEIKYIGSPYQLNRGDSDELRGFHILDCDDLSYSFVENNISIKFVSFNYPEEISEEKIKGNVVDIYIVDENIDSDKVQEYVESINKFKPIQNPTIKSIENFSKKDENGIETLKVKSLKEMFLVYLEGLELEETLKEKVYSEIELLYEGCQKGE